ncbi:MAG: class I tRNA ligase family protein [Dehalococcoidia bacterium]|nr:class I tRNA ligase family protein [Dehalococcoidia bacterium]
MQQEWIGRSEGAEIRFDIAGATPPALAPFLEVYTTRPDTVFGATYMVVAPEHPLCDAVMNGAAPVDQAIRRAVAEYCTAARNRSDVERQESKEKTGVFTGLHAVNPATGEKIPVWTADYVLMGYGHGAIMAVPAHDERDFEFAKKFNLPIRDVVYPRTQAAMAFFAANATVDDRSEVRWQSILSDFLGYTTTHSTQPVGYAAALHMVRTRRTRAGDGTAVPVDYSGPRTTVPGAVGSKRGSVSTMGLDAIVGEGFDSFEDMRATYQSRTYYARRAEAFTGPGVAVNSSNAGVNLDGMGRAQATDAVIAWLEREGRGRRKINFKLRDWLFSRQRYWGEPFPIVFDKDGNHHAVAEDALPVVLPDLKEYQPEESEEPRPLLAKARDWVNTTAGAAKVPSLDPSAPVQRETNTMPGWAGSCWYFLRYCDARNDRAFCGRDAERYWMGAGREPGNDGWRGVDLYVGGSEHAVLHLLYARFWHKVLFDLGHVSTSEPFRKLFHQGLITSYAYQRPDKSLVPIDHVFEIKCENPEDLPEPDWTQQPQQLKTPLRIRIFPVAPELWKAQGGYVPDILEARSAHPSYIDSLRRNGGSYFFEEARATIPLTLDRAGDRVIVSPVVAKMSKSLKNVVNPDDVIAEYGADTFRLYEMAMGPLDASKPWNPRDIVGCYRFLQKAWRLCVDEQTGSPRVAPAADASIERLLHRTVAKVEGDIERLAFNTAIAAMIEFVNAAAGTGLTRDQAGRFALTLCPFAPHLAEELWSKLGNTSLASLAPWPGYDEAMLREDSIEYPVQVQGKVRARINVSAAADAKSVEAAALADGEVQKYIAGKPVKKVIVVPGKLVSVVTG